MGPLNPDLEILFHWTIVFHKPFLGHKKKNNNNNRITLRLCQNRSVKVGPYTTPIFIQHNLVIFTMLFYLIFFRNRLSNVYGMSKALTSKEIIQ